MARWWRQLQRKHRVAWTVAPALVVAVVATGLPAVWSSAFALSIIKREPRTKQIADGDVAAYVRVRGSVGKTQGTIDTLEWQHAATQGAPTRTPAEVRALDADGKVLAVQRAATLGRWGARERYEAWLPARPHIDRIELRLGEQVVASRSAPRVQIVVPAAGGKMIDDDPPRVVWQGTDADGDGLLYLVEGSNDGGRTWEPIAITRAQSVFSRRVPRHNALAVLRITVSDGFFATAAESGSFLVQNQLPAEPYLPARKLVAPSAPVHHPHVRETSGGAPETGLIILSDPPGAKVTLDGRVLAGVTPMRVTGIAAVMHHVRIELARASRPFELWAGAASGKVLQLPLAELTPRTDSKAAERNEPRAWVPYGRRLVDIAVEAGGDAVLCDRALPSTFSPVGTPRERFALPMPPPGERRATDNLLDTVLSSSLRDDCEAELAARAQPQTPGASPIVAKALAERDPAVCAQFVDFLRNDDVLSRPPEIDVQRTIRRCVTTVALREKSPHSCFVLEDIADAHADVLRYGEDLVYGATQCAYDVQSLRGRFERAACDRMVRGSYHARCIGRLAEQASTPSGRRATCRRAYAQNVWRLRICEQGFMPLPTLP